MKNINYWINKLNNGDSVTVCFCGCLDAVVKAFGGWKSFTYTVGNMDRIKLVDPSMVAIID